MCTLIVASRVFQGAPLLVAANRDERLDRIAEPPGLVEKDGCRALMPRDAQEGGTWLGLSAAGYFVGVTNRFGAQRDERRRSRGLLVRDLLLCQDIDVALQLAQASRPQDYNPFHVVLADRSRAQVIWSDGDQLQQLVLPPGYHVLTERSFDAAPTQRPDQVLSALQQLSKTQIPPIAALQQLLGAHADDPFESTCVHIPALNYGTRSSTVLTLGDAVSDVRLWHADGPPCQTPLRDLSTLARFL